ncbi:hypothetical protein PSZ92_23610, partial [Shigella sonnei]|nr:hypothetical protein [Shigella sonnei]
KKNYNSKEDCCNTCNTGNKFNYDKIPFNKLRDYFTIWGQQILGMKYVFKDLSNEDFFRYVLSLFEGSALEWLSSLDTTNIEEKNKIL